MLAPFQRKIVAITPPGAIVDNAAFTTTTIDTAGYRFLTIDVLFGAMDIAMAGMKLQESDASNMAGAVDITASVMGTAVNDTGSASTLPSATADNTLVSFFVDLAGRKRYIDLVMTGGDGAAGTYLTGFAQLWRGERSPRNAVEAGSAQRMGV